MSHRLVKVSALCAKLSGTEAYDEVELRQEFEPLCLASCEQFCHGEVFQVLVVGDNVYQLS